jgi:hypothetical protein
LPKLQDTCGVYKMKIQNSRNEEHTLPQPGELRLGDDGIGAELREFPERELQRRSGPR